MSTADMLSAMELPWDAKEAEVCGNYAMAMAIAEASPMAKLAKLAPEARPAARMDQLLKQINEPLFPPIDPARRERSRALKAERVAAAEAAGPVTGATVYEPQPLHFKLPHGYWMREGCCVAVDSDDLVYVFCRGNMPVLVFDIEGELVNAWGNPTPFAGSHVYTDPYGNSAAGWVGNEWVSTHGIFIDHEEHLWLVDHVGHTITKATKEGKRLMIICPHGVVAKNDDEIAKIVSTGGFTEPAELQSGLPFNKPTDCWVDPGTGDIFITDGYGNSRVHRLKADGTPILSWGTPGTAPGEFQLVHNICGHPDGDKVIVCDRENSRVQVFDFDGNFVSQSSHHRAVSCAKGTGVNKDIVVIAEQGTHSAVFMPGGRARWGQPGGTVQNIGNKVTVQVGSDLDDRIISLGNANPGDEPDAFTFLHGVAMNSLGDIYAAEVSFTEIGQHQRPFPREMMSLRKWKRVAN